MAKRSKIFQLCDHTDKDPWRNISRCVATVSELFPKGEPEMVLVLGSGWGPVVEALGPKNSIEFSDLHPKWKFNAAPGHALKIWRCEHKKHRLLVFQGRIHSYQIDYSKQLPYAPVVLPALCAKLFGAKLLLTSSVGGIGRDLNPGDLMMASDFIPFVTPGPVQGGAYFASMENPADPRMAKAMKKAARATKQVLHQGVLGWTLGPQFESASQIAAYGKLGCDAIGMSVVPEWITARVGLPLLRDERPGENPVPTLALSAVSNKAAGLGSKHVSSEEVFETLQATMPKLSKLIPKFVELALKKS
jgi:purine-nucleoside phosphorylase